jgi:subtilisin family serine protease
VADADYYGHASGTAKGGTPASRVASYKVCTQDGCSSSALLKAIDDAVSDGVDVISISIGGMTSDSDFLSDPIALGAFHAQQKGVLVVCSGGNDGPNPYTVVNSAPWILTVAASTIDRTFQSSLQRRPRQRKRRQGTHLPRTSAISVTTMLSFYFFQNWDPGLCIKMMQRTILCKVSLYSNYYKFTG